jgi:hypothetical protein
MAGPGSGSERLLLALSGKNDLQEGEFIIHEIIRLVLYNKFDELLKKASAKVTPLEKDSFTRWIFNVYNILLVQ